LFAFSGLTAHAQNSTQDSPFQAPAGAAANANSAKERWELVGISVVGPKTSVCLLDNEKSQNRWLTVGEKSGALEIVSCDPKQDTAVIKISGQTKTLSLRKASVSAAITVLPAVAPVGLVTAEATTTPAVAPAAETSPLTEQQVQEREARMLVSDLLEIGMQQRKAYEEKKAAEDAAKKNPSPTPAAAQR
jgi:hypothetical protein